MKILGGGDADGVAKPPQAAKVAKVKKIKSLGAKGAFDALKK